MLVIRLSRVGKKKQPTYRLVVQDKRKDPWGKALDIMGHYDPRTKPKTLVFKKEKIEAWLAKGAKCSPAVHNLLVEAKVIKGPKLKATTKDRNKAGAAAAPKEAEKGQPTEEPKAEAAA